MTISSLNLSSHLLCWLGPLHLQHGSHLQVFWKWINAKKTVALIGILAIKKGILFNFPEVIIFWKCEKNIYENGVVAQGNVSNRNPPIPWSRCRERPFGGTTNNRSVLPRWEVANYWRQNNTILPEHTVVTSCQGSSSQASWLHPSDSRWSSSEHST